MKPRLLHPPCLLQQGGLFFLFVLLLSATSSAQNEDPYLIDPEKRTSASTPIPAGIIINLTYPVWGTAIESRTDQSVDIEKFLRYDIYGYVDGWQLGYVHQVYGNGFMIMPRSIGRDAYNGWYFLLGSQSGEQGSAQFPNGVEFGRTIYAIGSQVVSGFDDKVGFAYNLDVMIGYADGNDISVADSVIGEAGSNIILKTGGSVGARIPFGISGISIGAYGDLLFYPNQNDINGDIFLHAEIGLKLTGAFNLSL